MLKEFDLKSDAFGHTEHLPVKYTADGPNINPPLNWSNAPFDTKSFALIVDDPDYVEEAKAYWLVKNIPKDTREIKEDSVPGIELGNSFEKKSWHGPDFSFGNHRVFFRLYALNTFTIEEGDIHHFYRQLEKHKISEATLMGRYEKK